MQVFLETERLLLRRFTEADVDNLSDLDSDPEVMRFINGGTPTPREVIESDILPRYLRYYERFAGYGYWAAIEKATGEFLGWFHFRPAEGAGPSVCSWPMHARGCATDFSIDGAGANGCGLDQKLPAKSRKTVAEARIKLNVDRHMVLPRR